MTAEREIVRGFGGDTQCGKDTDHTEPGNTANPEGTCDAGTTPKVGTDEPKIWRSFRICVSRVTLRTEKLDVRCSCTK